SEAVCFSCPCRLSISDMVQRISGSSSTSNTFAMLALPHRSAGEIDYESGVAPLLAVNRDGAAMLADNSEGKAQSESGTAAFSPRGEERIKDLVSVFRRYADAVIKEFDSYQVSRHGIDGVCGYLKEL